MKTKYPLNWIDPDNKDQRDWLKDKFNIWLTQDWRTAFRTDNIRDALSYWIETDPRRLLHVQKWENTWRQKCYRAANKEKKRQVSFDLERVLIEDLKELAKYRGVTNTQVVRQLIGDAARQMRDEKVKERIRRKEYLANLSKLKAKNKALQQRYIEIIRGLSTELDHLLFDVCRAELLMPEGSDSTQVSDAAVADKVREKVVAIQDRVPIPRLMHFLRDERPFSRLSQEDT